MEMWSLLSWFSRQIQSSVFDCSFDHLRAIIKIRFLHECFRVFSVVLEYLFVSHLIHCIKIDMKKRSTGALHRCWWRELLFVGAPFGLRFWAWNHFALLYLCHLEFFFWYMSGLAGDVSMRHLWHVYMLGKGKWT